MRFGFNFRGDLAKLSDREIAAEMERLLEERQALYDSIPWIVADEKWLYRSGFGYWFGRGPIRSRVIYKLVGGYFGPFKHNPFDTLYRYDCELKDVRDEIERRVANRKKQAAR